MKRKKKIDHKRLGIGSLMEAHLRKNHVTSEGKREARYLYSLAGKELLSNARAKQERREGGYARARKLAHAHAPHKSVVSTIYNTIKSTTGKKPQFKVLMETLATQHPQVDWEKYDINGWWKKLNKGEQLI